VFSRIMHPGFGLPRESAAPMPFNVSLGTPLAAYPLVRAALAILDLAFDDISFEAASRLIRSPFLGGANLEMSEGNVASRRLNAVKNTTSAAIVSVSNAPARARSACPTNRVPTAPMNTRLPRPGRSAWSIAGSISTTDAASTGR